MRTAVVCIAKNEDRYIKEWAEYHLKLGFSSVFIYQNDWRTDLEMPNVFKTVIDGKCRQLDCYNKFLRKNKDHDWVAFIDVDEFIVLNKHSTINDFIKRTVKKFGKVKAIGINWVFFGSNGIEKDDGSFGVLKRFTKRGKMSAKVKSIVRVDKSIKMGVHNPLNCEIIGSNGRKFHGHVNARGSIDLIRLNHYYFKTKEEFVSKVARGKADRLDKRNASHYKITKHNEIEDFRARDFMYPPNNDTV
jgi:hypothetical protein